MSKEKHVLNITPREGRGKCPARRLRREGKIPAIVYSKGKPGIQITLDSSEWRSMMRDDVHLVHLVENGKERFVAIIKAVQEDFLKGSVTHVDMLEVDMNAAITSKVTVHSHGTAVGESQGGALEQVMHELEVSAKPEDLPEGIVVEVSALAIDQSLTAGNIPLPAGVSMVTDHSAVVFHVVKRQSETVAAAE